MWGGLGGAQQGAAWPCGRPLILVCRGAGAACHRRAVAGLPVFLRVCGVLRDVRGVRRSRRNLPARLAGARHNLQG